MLHIPSFSDAGGMLPLPPIGEANPKTMVEKPANLFQRHSTCLGKAKHREEKPNETNSRIKSKRTTWCHGFHHGQERERNDNVRTPTGDGHEHCTHGADFNRQTLGTHPGYWRDAGAKEPYVDYNGNQNDNTSPVDAVGFECKSLVIDRNIMKRDGGEREGERHAEHSGNEQSTASNTVSSRRLMQQPKKFMAPTTMDTATGLLNPTRAKSVPE
jgi:hypothetical protein